jgi:dTDP-4-dehydrorhamnose reductase
MGQSCGFRRISALGRKAVRMKILLTGKDGQVGFALHKKLVLLGEVIATGRRELDLANSNAIKAFIDKNKPNIIINAAAYTQVDKAESEKLLAHQINAIAPQILTDKASQLNIPIIHFSTDYVFDGLKHNPYKETDVPNPQSVYGQTKWEGEEAVRQYRKHIILRTSWVFGRHEKNFLARLLKYIQETEILYIVNDQKGAPTSANFLADVTIKIIEKIFNGPQFIDFGTYHVCSRGQTSWYEYACFVLNESIRLGMQPKIAPSNIKAISTSDYFTAAKRPPNSTLDIEKIINTFMIQSQPWQNEVKNFLEKII